MEFGLKRPRAFSAIRGRAFSMTRNIPMKRNGSAPRIEFCGNAARRRSLLQGIRFRGSNHFREEGGQEGGSIL